MAERLVRYMQSIIVFVEHTFTSQLASQVLNYCCKLPKQNSPTTHYQKGGGERDEGGTSSGTHNDSVGVCVWGGVAFGLVVQIQRKSSLTQGLAASVCVLGSLSVRKKGREQPIRLPDSNPSPIEEWQQQTVPTSRQRNRQESLPPNSISWLEAAASRGPRHRTAFRSVLETRKHRVFASRHDILHHRFDFGRVAETKKKNKKNKTKKT